MHQNHFKIVSITLHRSRTAIIPKSDFTSAKITSLPHYQSLDATHRTKASCKMLQTAM